MNYSSCSLEELEERLDAVVHAYANGDMHLSTYSIEFNEMYAAIVERKHPKNVLHSQENAYERAMKGV